MLSSFFLSISLLSTQTPSSPQTPVVTPSVQQFLQARGLQNQRKYTQALALYRPLETTLASSPELHLRLAECYKELGDLKNAWDRIEKAHALGPRQQEITIQWGLIAYARAQKENQFIPTARKVLKIATQQVPQEIELWGRSAELAEVEKDFNEALEAWLNVVALREDFIPAWERVLVLAQQLNRYESRRQATLYLVKKVGDKRSLSSLETLANEQLKKNYTMHAEESYTLLSQALATEADAWEVLGLIQLELKKYPQALASFQSALAIRPSHRIRFATAQTEMLLRHNEEAHSYLRSLWDEIKEDRQNPLRKKTQTLLVYNLFLMKRYNSLLEFTRIVQPKEDLDPIVSFHVFMTMVAKEDWPGARTQLHSLLNLQASEAGMDLKGLLSVSPNAIKSSASPNLLRAIAQRCRAEIHLPYLGEEAALALLKSPELSELKPAISTLMLESACWNNLGKTNESIEALRRAKALDPSNALVLNNLGYALLEAPGTLPEAASLLEEAFRLSPEDKNILDSIGWLRFKQSRYAEAEQLLLKAQALNPESFEVHAHLFECLEAQGRDDASLSFLEVALALRRQEEGALNKRRDDLRRKLNLKKLQLSPSSP